MKERNIRFDAMKGMAIILMVIGHHTGLNVGIRSFIYSFHMPLFFFVAGYFFRKKPIREELSSSAKRLLFPYLVTSIIVGLIYLCNLGFYESVLKRSFMGLALPVDTSFWTTRRGELLQKMSIGLIPPSKMYAVGPIWFLLAMFWCRMTYSILNIKFKGKRLLLISLIVSWIVVPIGHYISPFSCFSLLEGLSAVFMLSLGNFTPPLLLNCIRKHKTMFVFLSLAYWLIFLMLSKCEMVGFWYKIYPLDVLAAYCATFLIFVSMTYMPSKVLNFLAKVGVCSMLVLCIHVICSELLKMVGYYSHCYGLLLQLLMILISTFVLSKIRLFQKIFF